MMATLVEEKMNENAACDGGRRKIEEEDDDDGEWRTANQ